MVIVFAELPASCPIQMGRRGETWGRRYILPLRWLCSSTLHAVFLVKLFSFVIQDLVNERNKD